MGEAVLGVPSGQDRLRHLPALGHRWAWQRINDTLRDRIRVAHDRGIESHQLAI
ncbi:hypothetical protein [Nocardia sp. NPDC049526]|uniref:hypothetical protein n=1 Tax=Nocardia sp. NPDC049526 TaxID=3364316 RepID=UPI0037A1385D